MLVPPIPFSTQPYFDRITVGMCSFTWRVSNPDTKTSNPDPLLELTP